MKTEYSRLFNFLNSEQIKLLKQIAKKYNLKYMHPYFSNMYSKIIYSGNFENIDLEKFEYELKVIDYMSYPKEWNMKA